MSEVRVRENETLDSALRRFKRQCAMSGIMSEVRKREHYDKPSVRRKKGMSLKEKLQEDLKSSMKNKDTVRKSVVTLIRASIKQYEVDNRVELDDEGIIDIISKQLKQRRDALDEFAKANREDLVSETEAEIKVLKEYLPQQLSEEELNEIVKLTISEVGATSMKDMGKIMSVIRPKVKGRADGKLINELVKANLQ